MKAWLNLPAQLAHDLGPLGLKLYSLVNRGPTPTWKPLVWKNIVFKNRLGIAGGVDKNADLLNVWSHIGCGFAEVGTVTPEAQSANAGKILDRSLEDQALWNRMGFPSAGGEDVFYNVRHFKDHHSLPVFINIGKNRTTSNEDAFKDYVSLLERFYSVADVFVVNISSPNTAGLRDLAQPEYLNGFLKPLKQAQHELMSERKIERPLLLKLSPDLADDDLKRIVDTSCENGVDGFILTNTTLSRTTKKAFPVEGGVSGAPLKEISKKALKTAVAHLGKEKSKKLLISVGGVMTADDVFERIEMGADLIEVYTALVLSGPGFFKEVAQRMAQRGK